MGKTMDEITSIVKGAKVIEGTIFDRNHRNQDDYKKFLDKVGV